MIRNSRFSFRLFLFLYAVVFAASGPFVLGQNPETSPQGGQTRTEPAPDRASNAQAADVAGDWQVAWTSRNGTQQCSLRLQQDGTKLTGTFQDVHGVSKLSGTVDAKQVSFDVEFGGRRPFTIRFTGTAGDGKIEGASQAVGVAEFFGHGGEVVHPEHPWTARRVANSTTQPDQARSMSESVK